MVRASEKITVVRFQEEIGGKRKSIEQYQAGDGRIWQVATQYLRFNRTKISSDFLAKILNERGYTVANVERHDGSTRCQITRSFKRNLTKINEDQIDALRHAYPDSFRLRAKAIAECIRNRKYPVIKGARGPQDVRLLRDLQEMFWINRTNKCRAYFKKYYPKFYEDNKRLIKNVFNGLEFLIIKPGISELDIEPFQNLQKMALSNQRLRQEIAFREKYPKFCSEDCEQIFACTFRGHFQSLKIEKLNPKILKDLLKMFLENRSFNQLAVLCDLYPTENINEYKDQIMKALTLKEPLVRCDVKLNDAVVQKVEELCEQNKAACLQNKKACIKSLGRFLQSEEESYTYDQIKYVFEMAMLPDMCLDKTILSDLNFLETYYLKEEKEQTCSQNKTGSETSNSAQKCLTWIKRLQEICRA